MADLLSAEEIAEFKEVFSLLDRDGDGQITAKDFGDIMRSMGQSPTDAEVQDLINTLDVDGNSTVNFSEFLTAMSKKKNNPSNEDEILEAFQALDSDGNGFVSRAELKLVMNNLGERLTDTQVDEIVRKGDLDCDGRINYREFMEMMILK